MLMTPKEEQGERWEKEIRTPETEMEIEVDAERRHMSTRISSLIPKPNSIVYSPPHSRRAAIAAFFEYKTNFYVYDLLESFSHPGHNLLWSPNQSR